MDKISFTVLRDISTRENPEVVFHDVAISEISYAAIQRALAGIYGVDVNRVVETYQFAFWRVEYLKEQHNLWKARVKSMENNQEATSLHLDFEDDIPLEECKTHVLETQAEAEQAQRGLECYQYSILNPNPAPWPGLNENCEIDLL